MTTILDQLVEEIRGGGLRVVDLTQLLHPGTPIIDLPAPFAGAPGFSIEQISHYDAHGPAWYWNTIGMGEHTGTHLDAPIHWVTGRNLSNATCDAMPATRFIGPACVIDVEAEVEADSDFLLDASRIKAWEADHGTIPAGAWVLMRSGWSRRTELADYLNESADGPHSPGWTKDAVELLACDRDVLGVGVETIGTDAGQAARFDPAFPVHHVMHGAGKFGLASLCNLQQLPTTGAVLVAAPLKIVNGSGSPVRAFAIAPASN